MNWERRIQYGAHPFAYPAIRALARVGPVIRVPGLGVVVSDAALAHEVLGDSATYTKTGPGSSADLWTPVLGPAVLLNMEGEEHRALRRRLAGLFSASYVDRLCTRALGAPLADLTDRLRSGEPVEFVGVVQRLVGAVIAELVGLSPDPRTVQAAYREGTAITSMVRLGRRTLTPRQVTIAKRTLAALTAPASVAYAAGDPETVPGRLRELGMSEPEARGAVAALVLTGTETLVSYLPRLVALAHDSGWLARLAADPSRVPAVVAEALRVTVPSPVMLRSVIAPARLGKVPVHPGDRIVIATLSCAQAYGPFDPERPHPPQLRRLWFGGGAHFCLGAPLAMAEINAVFAAVLAAPEVHVVERRVARRVLIPGYARLVLRS
ncbi:cytochrome P450 [Dactylosporangium sp. NPDC051484]|uniref:cytochrome P450 n=1 Tax=Dactylosporangium sp. NPDC051484 TaxID=3154942 RepID=UPI00344C32AC